MGTTEKRRATLPAIIKLNDVSKSFDGQKLYESVNIKINAGEKVLICGENGCGKTTMIHMITGEAEPDSGNVWIDKAVKFAKLDQYEIFDGKLSVKQYIENIFHEVALLERQLRSIENVFSRDYSEGIFNQYNELLDRFEAMGGYNYLQQENEFIKRFELEDKLEKSIDKLSGGEQQYLRLASVIYSTASLLILDEPFTFLDQAKAIWLVNYLKAINKTVILVSHDSYLVREFATDVISIDNWEVKKYKNGFDSFEAEKESDRKKSIQLNSTIDQYIVERQTSILQKTEWMKKAENKHQHAVMIRRMKRDVEKAYGHKQNFKEILQFDISKLVADQAAESNDLLIQLIRVTKSLGGKVLLRNISLSIYENEHYVFIGDNGAGKTTLLNLIMKNIVPTSGEIVYKKRFSISYLPQVESGDNDKITAFGYISNFTPLSVKELEMTYSDYFESGFWNKRLCTLSGGEKRRLFLFCRLLHSFDILVLDEPTTFVDDNAKNKMIDMINSTPHCVILVTHDPDVFSKVNGKKLLLSNGDLQPVNIE